MKVTTGFREVEENYKLEQEDSIIIKNQGEITHIFINGEELRYITEFKLEQKAVETPILKVKRIVV